MTVRTGLWATHQRLQATHRLVERIVFPGLFAAPGSAKAAWVPSLKQRSKAMDMNEASALTAMVPAILLLALGVLSTLLSRALRLSPIVGYIGLGLALRAAGAEAWLGAGPIDLLAELGVMLMLFDIGLHFSLDHLRAHAADIFAFGPVQVLTATAALGLAGMAAGLPGPAAFLLGAILALSSTAVVGRLIAERRQQGCPVGLTATSILVFQDVAAIILLVVAGAIQSGGSLWAATFVAVMKAAGAFAVTVLFSRLVVDRALGLIARSRNDEVFTAASLSFALAAGWATASVGLSLTLGAFLGGQALSATQYRRVVESEIKPFRGLLLGFFFVSIGLSLDPQLLVRSSGAVLGTAAAIVILKTGANIVAALIFRWSVPGSTQLGFLLGQGSEFAFVVLALPAVQSIVGRERTAVAIAAVALSIAATPNVAEVGRKLAGRMRRRQSRRFDSELTPVGAAAPVVIVGMGSIGRLVADAMIAFGIDYLGLEADEGRLRTATADGYRVAYGNGTDARLWAALSLGERKVSVITAPEYEEIRASRGAFADTYPGLKRFAYAMDEAAAGRLRQLGLNSTADSGGLPAVSLTTSVLSELGVPGDDVRSWLRRRLQPVGTVPEPIAWGGLG